MQTTILQGDCLETLKTIGAGTVQTCVTSPPYYGLRDYGTAEWEGGDPACDHSKDRAGGVYSSGLQGGKSTTNHQQEAAYRNICGKCGAIRVDEQIGLEETPEAYVDKLVQVFREVRRALADDGTLWLNLGDSYNNTSGFGRATNGHHREGRVGGAENKVALQHPTIKTKDLLGIPWMVAFALRADGWYLRSDIIWHKPNPMPESVTDRPTKSHEYIFLLSKSAQYYYDHEAVREPQAESSRERAAYGWNGRTDDNSNGARTGSTFKRMAESGEPIGTIPADGFRNKRDVWTVTTKPYAEAHFATFPPDLIEPCILAGSRVGDIVLDPFNGSGTTGAVAIKHHRSYIGCELNPEYITLTNKRLGRVQPVLFANV